jgi:hypothetical protein
LPKPPLTHARTRTHRAAASQAACAGLDAGHAPRLEADGLGGTYLLRGGGGERLAMFKPCDEEPFAPNNPKGFAGRAAGPGASPRAVRVGEAAYREVAAYLLDHGHFCRVPRTALVRLSHPCAAFHVAAAGGAAAVPKLGSLQEFVRHDYDASEHGTSRFPVAEVHRLGILDLRLFNTDRHTGNILIRAAPPARARAPQHCRSALELGGAAGGAPAASSLVGALSGDAVELVPIDHGYCLPENLEAVYFEWLHWPQASMPFSRETLQYIASLDGDADAAMLARELPELRPAARRLLQLTTLTLQRAAAAGLCLAEIGALMSRPLVRIGEEPSALERVMAASLEALAARAASASASPSPGASPHGAAPHGASPGSAHSESSDADADAEADAEGDAGWAEESPLGELSEGDEDAAAASLRPTPSATPRIAVPGRVAAAAHHGASDEFGFQFDLDDGDDGDDADGSSSAHGDSGSASAFSSHASSATDGTAGGGGMGTTPGSFMAAAHAARSPSRPRPAAPSARHAMGAGASGAAAGGSSAWSPRRGGVRSAPRPAEAPLGRPTSAGAAAGAGVGMLGRSFTARPPGGAGLARRMPGSARGAAQRDAGAPAASLLRASLCGVPTEPDAHDGDAAGQGDCEGGADAASRCPASFAEVPPAAWRSFLALFVPSLDGALREHAARCAGARATQLVTHGGTRMELFGTSCPTPTGWLEKGRR